MEHDDDHTCRECRDGKHSNCDGVAWCDYFDELTACSCMTPH